MKLLACIFLAILLSSCAPVSENIRNPTGNDIVVGEFREANPFWRYYQPGTILLVGDDSVDMLHDNSWLSVIGSEVRRESIEDLVDRQCEGNLCEAAVSTEQRRGWTAFVKATFNEDNYLSARGINVREIKKSVYHSVRTSIEGMSASSALREFKNDSQYADDYEAFKSRIGYRHGGREGDVVVVSEIELVLWGEFSLIFDQKITVEAEARIEEIIAVQLGGEEEGQEFGYIIDDSTFKVKADPTQSRMKPFLDSWKIDRAEL